MVKMDLRVVTIDVTRQEVMTRDNVPVTVDAVVYFRVIDPAAAVVRVENYLKATSLISQTTLRSVLGQAELDELLAQRDKINRERRAKIINAEGEYQAAEKLVQAASMISTQPIALQLRFLQTMKEISSEHNTTTILPVPIELFTPLLNRVTNQQKPIVPEQPAD
jgi:regulator of protease activity HflC (stomatin/prohibitin superfamily)